jgi:hypothetical protein
MNARLHPKLISKFYQRIPAIEIFFSKIWWVKIMPNNWVKVPSKMDQINRVNRSWNLLDQLKTVAIRESKIFKIIDSKTLNQLMKQETINKTNLILAAKVSTINQFKTIEAKKIMKIWIQAIAIVKALDKIRVAALIEMKIFFARS